MTDKELLELAAKAAGIKIVGLVSKMIAQPDHKNGGFVVSNEFGGDSCWNPLTDDGDAFRLAVTIGTNYKWGGFDVEIRNSSSGARNFCYVEKHGKDPYAATRRAIVRAAAEIGKAMP